MRWQLAVLVLFGVACYFSYDEVRWAVQATEVPGKVQGVADIQKERRGRRGRRYFETVRVVQCSYDMPKEGPQIGGFETSTSVELAPEQPIRLQVLSSIPPSLRLSRSISVWPFLGVLAILGYWGWMIIQLLKPSTMPQYDSDGNIVSES